jgi:hypothetical protein
VAAGRVARSVGVRRVRGIKINCSVIIDGP